MEIQNESEAFERFKAKQIGIDYETLKKDLDDCEKRFPNNRYAGWNFKSDWELWQAAKAQAVPEGFVLVNAESLALHAQSIRMFNNGDEEDDYYKIENHVCAIEAMIEAQEQSHE